MASVMNVSLPIFISMRRKKKKVSEREKERTSLTNEFVIAFSSIS
jgi:hypothetical protein